MAIRDPERYFDRRTLKRHLKRGNATEADHQSYLATLPDLADSVKSATDGGDDDGFEARAQAKARRASGEILHHSPLSTPSFPVLKRAPIVDDDDDDDDDFDDDDDDDDDEDDDEADLKI
jgi:hypothetical protein